MPSAFFLWEHIVQKGGWPIFEKIFVPDSWIWIGQKIFQFPCLSGSVIWHDVTHLEPLLQNLICRNTTAIKLRLILIHYLRNKMSLLLQIGIIYIKKSLSSTADSNMSTWDLTEPSKCIRAKKFWNIDPWMIIFPHLASAEKKKSRINLPTISVTRMGNVWKFLATKISNGSCPNDW